MRACIDLRFCCFKEGNHDTKSSVNKRKDFNFYMIGLGHQDHVHTTPEKF